MARKKPFTFPKEQFGVIETGDNVPYVVHSLTIEEALEYADPDQGETIEIGVYKLEKVIKVKKEASYKIVK